MGFKFVVEQQLLMIGKCQMTIDTSQHRIVAVGCGSVGTGDSILPYLDGTWCLAHIAIGAAEEVMGTDSLVGSAMMVEIVYGFTEQAIRGDGDIVAVQAVGLVEHGQHGGTTAAAVTSGDGEQSP